MVCMEFLLRFRAPELLQLQAACSPNNQGRRAGRQRAMTARTMKAQLATAQLQWLPRKAQLQWLPLRPHVRVRHHVLKALDSPGRGLFALRLLSSNKEAPRRRALTASSCGALSSFFNASICASETFLASSAAFAELPRLLQRRVAHQVGPCWAYDHFCVLRIVLDRIVSMDATQPVRSAWK